MLILYAKNCKIQSFTDKFIVNGQEFFLKKNTDLLSLVIKCTNLIKTFNQQQFLIENKPKQYSKADTVILLAMGLLYRSVFCIKDACHYDITFSYNFPIVYEKQLVPAIIEVFEHVVKAQLVALGLSHEFIVADVSNIASYRAFIKKNGYLMKRNDKDVCIEIRNNLYEILINWKQYCAAKFYQQYPMDAIYAYMKVYSLEGFRPLTYSFNGEIIGQGVLYHSKYSKTNYYCIFSWNEKFKKKSPGIYAYIKVIDESHRTGYKFSFCYGLQSYKATLLFPFMCDKDNGGIIHV